MASIAAETTAAAKEALPLGMKRWLKGLVRAYHQRCHAFTPLDLRRALVHLGIAPGNVVMVHSAFDRFAGFRGGPLDVVRTLQDTVGPNGTLLMPTMPFRGTAVEYALGDPLFDAQRTPSRMGLITEVFRRSRGVVRSLHPTHSVAAWGRRAQAMVAGHEEAQTPCGRLSPYGRLLEHDGKILLAGVSPHTMTFCYFVAEELAAQLTFQVFTSETYPMRWKDRDGTVRVSDLRLFSLRLDHDLSPLLRELKRRRHWREHRIGRLRLILVRAREVYDAAMALADNGRFLRERASEQH